MRLSRHVRVLPVSFPRMCGPRGEGSCLAKPWAIAKRAFGSPPLGGVCSDRDCAGVHEQVSSDCPIERYLVG